MHIEKLKKIFKILIPAMVTLISYSMVEVISTIFNGHLPEKEMIAASGLSHMYPQIVCVSLMLGMNNTLSTFISQSFGSGNLAVCGQYLNRARVIVTIMFIPMIVLLLLCETILLWVGLDEKTS